MADRIDATTLRAALNLQLSADGITVGIREVNPTDAWIFAWRVNSTAEVRILHVPLDVADPNLIAIVVETIRREFREHP
jgi:hypothetical protein